MVPSNYSFPHHACQQSLHHSIPLILTIFQAAPAEYGWYCPICKGHLVFKAFGGLCPGHVQSTAKHEGPAAQQCQDNDVMYLFRGRCVTKVKRIHLICGALLSCSESPNS